MWLVELWDGSLKAFRDKPVKVSGRRSAGNSQPGIALPLWLFPHIPTASYKEPKEVELESDPGGRLWAHLDGGRLQDRDTGSETWFMPRWMFEPLKTANRSFRTRIVPTVRFTPF